MTVSIEYFSLMKLMKKLTIYSFTLTILIGIILPLLNATVMSLYDEGDGFATFLISCFGFLLTFVFLILWQAEVGRRNLVITIVCTGSILFSWIAYITIKVNESDKERFYEFESKQEMSRKYGHERVEHNLTKIKLDSVTNELIECRSND